MSCKGSRVAILLLMGGFYFKMVMKLGVKTSARTSARAHASVQDFTRNTIRNWLIMSAGTENIFRRLRLPTRAILTQSLKDLLFFQLIRYTVMRYFEFSTTEGMVAFGLFVGIVRPSNAYIRASRYMAAWGEAALEVANQYNSVYIDAEDIEREKIK